ncbi:methionine--tRNA ligase [Cronobacter dublinensis]|uniref:methionine--tRNA ligase n=1 Tax=Cronobacter dublinensis TaxID=413497 RepID=UPI000D005A31|nr:methionine--tRNA ligase [Cronobacter dublinensis]ELY9424822.1 methionine--tRNA ligase [Cronobacter dublinensis]
MAKYIVTITPPTPNGDLHLGHLSGPFLAADVMRRTLRDRGHDVLFVCYSDDYQSYLPRKTSVLMRQPFDYGRLMRRAMSLSLELADIHLDHFMQAADSSAYRLSGEHYAACVSHQVSLRPAKTFHCAACDRYGYEGFGRTHCNWCGTSSDTSQCEHCARVPDVEQIENMTCMSCQGPMTPVRVKLHVWDIGQNYPAVAAALRPRPQRACLTQFLDEVLADTRAQWHITRPGDAGLPVAALDYYPLHTWFLGMAGYRASVMSYLEENPARGSFAEWWSPQTELVHFLGFDCSYSHAVAYSSQLLADDTGPRPGTFLTNRFLKLDGEDFSTSRGHAIWIKDLTGLYPADAIRLYCARYAPETEVKNFSRADFQHWYQTQFLPLAAHIADAAPFSASLTPAQEAQLRDHPARLKWLEASTLNAFSISAMAEALLELTAFIQTTPAFAASAQAWEMLAEMASPLCPGLAQNMQHSVKRSIAA